MKRIALTMLALLCTLTLTACGSDAAKGDDKEVLTIGIDDTFAPMGFKKDGSWSALMWSWQKPFQRKSVRRLSFKTLTGI